MRYLTNYILKDLQKKMVFIGGPRQCGKTTLAQHVLKKGAGQYFNWDADEDRRDLLAKKWDDASSLLVFDEIHKFPRWKNWLKGVYDTQKHLHHFLITGSARLNVYKRGGDSLLGRYHYWRLHPFTLSEIPLKISLQESFKRLMAVGGFPEPFFDGDEREARRWRKERFEKVLKDDIRDLEKLRELKSLDLLVDLLRHRVGSLIVVSNLAKELQVADKTIKHWLEILEKMHVIFIVRTLSKNIARAILKPFKVFFYDNADVIGDEGAVFENLVATHLLKKIQFLEDYEGYYYDLFYIRDKEGREVDFAIMKDGKLEELYEAKWADTELHRPLQYYAERLKPKKAIQVLGKIKRPYSSGQLQIDSALSVLSQWPLFK